MSMLDLPLTELVAALRRREVSSRELTEQALARINADHHNAFITITDEQALAAADAADARLSNGDSVSPLTGVPIAHKDIFCTRGIKTTCGSKILADFVPPYEATVVRRFRDAGTVLLGKTNMDEFAMGSSTESGLTGAARNPWDSQRVAGGSSGGSAVAVAAGLVPLATGTDTGGSVRQPAAFCGISGIKPTYGRVSRYGMVAYASSLDQGGIMARSVDDLSLALPTLCGFDANDSTSLQINNDDLSQPLNISLRDIRIGIPRAWLGDGLEGGIAATIGEAMRCLQDLGATLVDIDLPTCRYAVNAYYVIATAEASANLARYDGVRYGYRDGNEGDLHTMYERTRTNGFGLETRRRIMMGTYVLSAGYYDAYYRHAQKIRRLVSDELAAALQQVNAVLTPVSPLPPFLIGEKVADPVSMYLADIYTVPVNLAGLPGLAIPAGFADELPVGMQLIGPACGEMALLGIGKAYQQVTDYHRRMPPCVAETMGGRS